MAAVWDRWQGPEHAVESCALVTVEADPRFRQIHRRMPLMLVGGERQRWLDVSSTPAANDPLFAPTLKLPLRATPISRGVNNARNKAVDLLSATGEPLLIG